MARHFVLVDDLDGTEGAETISYTINGQDYEIDLSEDNAEKFHDTLEPYIQKSREVRRQAETARRRDGRRRSSGGGSGRDDIPQIRAWAESQGMDVSARGRIKKEIIDAYNEGHSWTENYGRGYGYGRAPVIMPRSIHMNEITIVGNVTADPILRMSGNGRGVVRFDLAINRWCFNRDTSQYDDLPPVFHRVVASGPVAENAAETLRKGLEVVVVGQMADDSYETEAGEKRRQVVLEAQVIAASLRFAKANVIRVQRDQPAPEAED